MAGRPRTREREAAASGETPSSGGADAAPKAPAKKATASKGKGSGSSSGGSKRGRKRSLKRPLQDMVTTLGTMLVPFQPFDGFVLIEGAEPMAKALDELAQNDPAVYRALDRMLTGSAWGGVFTAVAGIAVPIAANHLDTVPDGMKAMGSGARAQQRAAEHDETVAKALSELGSVADLFGQAAAATPNGQAPAEGDTPPADRDEQDGT